eukprot:5943199-Alexandrium_andersonii.AAC.1
MGRHRTSTPAGPRLSNDGASRLGNTAPYLRHSGRGPRACQVAPPRRPLDVPRRKPSPLPASACPSRRPR